MRSLRFFRRLDGSRYYTPPPVLSVTETLELGFAELLKRAAFTAIGVIMVWWAWSLLTSQIPRFPNVDWFAVVVGIFTIVLGIRNALSIFKDLTWGQVFLTLLFVVVNAYLLWFT